MGADKEKMKLLVFDIDETLTETNEIDTVCYVIAIKKVLGLSEIDTQWEAYSYATDSGIAEEISQRYRGIPISENELIEIELELVSLLRVESQKSAQLFAPIGGARETIDFFKKSDLFGISIATGGWEGAARLKLDVAGIDIGGIPIASSSDSFDREEIMKISHERSKAHYGKELFEEIIYFGDASWDYKASSNLGWRMIGIGKKIEKLRKLGVESTLKNFHDLKAVLETLNAQQCATANCDRWRGPSR